MKSIEFRDNGTSDTLTGSPTFRIFLSQLDREIALRKRVSTPLSILSISIADPKDDGEIVLLNESIRREIRNEDFYCRASEDGFWIGLRADSKGAKEALLRFIESGLNIFNQVAENSEGIRKPISNVPHFDAQVHEYRGGLTSEKWIEQIDRLYFKK